MKQFLLLFALAMGAFAAKADTYSDYYRVSDIEGDEILNGQTIYCTHFEDHTHLDGMNMGYMYRITLIYGNYAGDDINLYAELGCTDRPTLEDYKAHKWDYVDGNWYTKYGDLVAGFAKTISASATIILNELGSARVVEVEGGNFQFNWQIQCSMIDPTSVVEYTLTTKVCDRYDVDTAKDDTSFTVKFVFGPSMEAINAAYSGVNDIEADNSNAPAEYFNLQGERVDKPENGLYIKRQGGKATKVLVK